MEKSIFYKTHEGQGGSYLLYYLITLIDIIGVYGPGAESIGDHEFGPKRNPLYVNYIKRAQRKYFPKLGFDWISGNYRSIHQSINELIFISYKKCKE